MFPVILIFCLSTAFANPINYANQCVVSIKYKRGDLKEPQPLVLQRDEEGTRFLYPDDNEGNLRIPRNQSIFLACPGKNNYIQNTKFSNELKATCVQDTIFIVNGVKQPFSSLTCNYMPRDDAKLITSRCLGEHSTIEIGFNVTGGFLRTIEICRNDKTYVTYYTKYRLTKAIGSYQKSYPRPPFWSVGGFYGTLDVQNLYRMDTQFSTISRILNSTKLAKERIQKSVQYLSRGHLTAKADFVYGSQQISTFWYMNAAPQWISFNSGNWNFLEISVRQFASNRQLDLEVYTGVHGQMTMTNANGEKVPIYLYANGTNRALPVPKFYWKVIYDPSTRKGTAFVGLNDPFVKSITKDLYLCPDISPRIDWLLWKPKKVTEGISYACTIGDLRKAVPTVPRLKVTDILV